MAAAKTVLEEGDPSALEKLLVGRRIWVVLKEDSRVIGDYDCRVLSFRKWLPAGPVAEGEPRAYDSHRTKHLVQLWTDPGGMRTLSVGSIRLKDPGKTGEVPKRTQQVSAQA